jgi:folate-dependent phosphoribosylglycinamide formyltransferase PurN
MRGKNKNKIYLVIDEANECPAIEKASKEKMKKYIKYLKKYLEADKTIKLFKKYPKVIVDYDCDLTRVCYLKNLTKEIIK